MKDEIPNLMGEKKKKDWKYARGKNYENFLSGYFLLISIFPVTKISEKGKQD